MQERPKDLIDALKFAKQCCEVPSISYHSSWLAQPDAWPKLFEETIRELTELREQYAIQNDSYSRLYKQVYG